MLSVACGSATHLDFDFCTESRSLTGNAPLVIVDVGIAVKSAMFACWIPQLAFPPVAATTPISPSGSVEKSASLSATIRASLQLLLLEISKMC